MKISPRPSTHPTRRSFAASLKRRFAILLLMGFVGSLAVASPAAAVPLATPTPANRPALADPQKVFVVTAPTSDNLESSFYPLPEEAKGSLIVVPEVAISLGLPAGQVSESQRPEILEKLSTLDLTKSEAVPDTSLRGSNSQPLAAQEYLWSPFSFLPGGSYYGPYKRSSSFIGSNGFDYQWLIAAGSNSQACTLGAGYYTGYNGGSFGLWKNWYGLGCGYSGGAHVPWDNVAAYPELMAKSMYGLTGGSGLFR